MHARELVELAAIVSACGPVFVRGTARLAAGSIEQYWVASKCRLDRWGRLLKQYAAETAKADARLLPDTPQDQPKWPDARGVLEEVLTGEVLTRVWSAVLCAYDRRRGTNEAEPVARSVMIGHLEARHRVLTLLSRTPAIDAEAAVRLNYLRRRTERWADLLLARLAGLHEIGEFAIDPARARDFAQGFRHRGSQRGSRHAWPLVLASLRASFQRGLSAVSPNADLNAKIASSVLSCFQPELFDSLGLLHSLWMLRVLDVADDAQGMLQDLVALEQTAAEGDAVSAAARWQKRLRRFGK